MTNRKSQGVLSFHGERAERLRVMRIVVWTAVTVLFMSAHMAQADSLTSAIDSVARTALAHHAPGIAIAVEKHGRIVLERGYGVRDLTSNSPVTPQTRFEIASITKQFTAAAILQLAEQHRLSLDDKLGAYIPNFELGRSISLRQLLWQVTGIPNYVAGPDIVRVAHTQPPSLSAMLKRIQGKPLHFRPGSKWEYSNTNYALLAYVIEAASHESYEHYVRTHLFAPAGMTESGFVSDELHIGNMARGYLTAGGTVQPSPLFFDRWALGIGDIISTVGDLVRWDNALLAGKIMKLRDIALMRAPGRLLSGKMTGYGFGWYVDRVDGQTRIWHDGATFGFNAMNGTFPAADEVVIVLDNNFNVQTEPISTKIFRVTQKKSN